MKKWMLILLAAALTLLLTACGSKPAEAPTSTEAPAATEAPEATGTPEATEVPAATEAPADESGETLQQRTESIAKDASELAPFSADELADMTGIEPDDYTDFVFLQGDVMEGREILALRAKDEAAAEKLAGQMEKYLERRRDENKNYAPKAYQALCDAKVEQKGLLLVMISGENAETETAAMLAGE